MISLSRKEDILDALGDIIQAKGINANFTISELAHKVDIGKSTIYEYFKTKDELLSEAMIRVFKNAMEQIEERRLDPSKSFEESLKDELSFAFDLATGSSYIFKFLTPDFRDTIPSNMKGQFAEYMRKTTKQYEELFRNLVAKGIEEGVLKPGNLSVQAALFASIVSGSIQYVARAENEQAIPVDHEELIHGVYDTILHIFN